jgi:UDP-N-acetylmuramyl tripeptide synthase
MIIAGIREVNPDLPVKVIPDEAEALEMAFSSANPGDMVFICADKVKNTIEMVENYTRNSHELNAS